MSEIALNPPLTGDEIKKRMSEKIIHEPIAEGFLYKNASIMISSQPSIGKSVLAIQAALELSNGLPLFGQLHVPRPIRVWYVQAERSDIESLERLQLMIGDRTDIQFNNLFIDTELQSLNFLNPVHQVTIMNRAQQIKPELIIIDPLYGIAQGLSKDEVGSAVAKALTTLKKLLGCAIWINHHTVKTTYEILGGIRVPKSDPFYGAQWLKAHVTGSYLAEMGDKGVHLQCRKDSHSILLKDIKLSFDSETYLSSIIAEETNYRDKYLLFIESLKKSGKSSFFFDEVVEFLGCSTVSVRRLNTKPEIRSLFTLVKSNGRKTLYKLN